MVGTHRLWWPTMVALLVVLTTAPGVVLAAQSGDAQSEPIDLNRTVEQYNDRTDEVPSIVTETISDERIAVEVDETDSGTETYYIETGDDGEITDYGTSEPSEEVTIRLETDESVLTDIQQADDQKTEAIQRFNDGDIEAEGTDVMTRMEVNFADSVLSAKNLT